MTITRAYAPFSGGQIHYRQTAPRAGRPLVLLHQTPSSSAMYEAMLRELAADYWAIAPDTPGFGLSDRLPEPATIKGYATAVYNALQSGNITSCYLFGHHTGAAVAVQMAHDHPEFVSRLVLSGPPLLTAAQIAYLQTTLPVTDLDENGRFLTDLWQRLHQKIVTPQLALTLRETIAALQCRDSYHEAYFAVFAQDLGGQLAALRCPVLLLAGEADSLIASLEPAAQLVINGRWLRISGAGTYLCDQQPRLVANLVREFLGAA